MKTGDIEAVKPMMTMLEAIERRHTVRKFLSRPIPVEIVEALKARAREDNGKYDTDIKLMVDDERAVSGLVKLFLAENVQNYFILAGPESPFTAEHLGSAGADLMLYAQTLGLNTWWIGGTYNRKAVAPLADGKKLIGVIAVGYGKTQGARHRSKREEQVSYYLGTAAPQWFYNGVHAALLAPTAMNRQTFFIRGEDNCISIQAEKETDLGIVKYHFELGAGKENFVWKK